VDRAAEMLEYVRQCASIAAEVARKAGRKNDHVAFALTTLYDGLLEIYEGAESGGNR
jgi:hypothetical protein